MRTNTGVDQSSTPDSALADLSRAGDILAETLGNVLVKSEEDRLTEDNADGARQAILYWHQLRARVAPR